MAEPRNDQTSERYETTDPRNPPNSMVSRETRRAAFWSYFGPVLALFVIVGIALIYWANRGPAPRERVDVGDAIGTAGERSPGESSPGGFEPQGRPGSTRDELERRGAGQRPQGPTPGLSDLRPVTDLDAVQQMNPTTGAGRPVDLRDVEVESAQGNYFWVRDEKAKVAVIASEGAPDLRPGMRVNVSGTAEPDGSGGVRIRAAQVDIHK
jgi:hypothetical protein